MSGHRYDTSGEVLSAIGDDLLVRINACGVEARAGGAEYHSVVEFELGGSGQFVVVARNNLWRQESEVIGARRSLDGRLKPVFYGPVGRFTDLHEIPAAIERVMAWKGEW